MTTSSPSWPPPPESHDDFERIGSFFDYQQRQEEENPYFLDEQAVKDLDFHAFFQAIDFSLSAPGQQYLYHSIRRQQVSPQQRAELEGRIEKLEKDPDSLEAIQKSLRSLTKGIDYYFPFLIFGELPAKIRFFPLIRLAQLLILAALVAGIFYPALLFFLLIVFLGNVVLHYWHKSRIGRFVQIFSRLPRLTRTAKKLLSQLPPEGEQTMALQQAIKRLEKVSSKVLFLKTENLMENDLSSIVWYLIEFIKIATLAEITTFHRLVDEIREIRGEMEEVFTYLGEVDKACAVLALRKALPYYCLPDLQEAGKQLDIQGVYHPLVADCVPNDLKLVEKSLLLTGSNMAGKSTFIKAINLSIVAAQSLNTAFARQYQLPRLALATSIRISDNIQEARSYYMEEVHLMKKLLGLAKTQEIQYLFTIDEVFKGTNTIERISAAKAILEHLNQGRHLVLVSTHDVELTQMLAQSYELQYFQEKVDSQGLSFDYQLRKGALKEKNAIKILEMEGYPDEVVSEAKKMAERLEKKVTNE
jgi:energy-coupling factor transporter ATP-binding protein EcfA2